MQGRSHRSLWLVGGLGAALVVAGAARRAGAGEPITSVALRLTACADAVPDPDALVVALGTTLPSSLGTATTVTQGADDGAPYRIELVCQGAERIDATLTRTAPHAVAHDRISVAHIAAEARPGTLALALGERLGALRARTTPPPVDPPDPPPETQPPPNVSPERHERRLRVTRDLMIVGAPLALACIVVGGPLVAVGTDNKPDNRTGLIVGGAVLLGIGGAALITTFTSLGLWLRERRR